MKVFMIYLAQSERIMQCRSLLVAFLLLMSLLATNVYADKPLEKVSLQLSWKYQFEFAGFIMAKEKGYYRDVGLDVELLEYHENSSIIDDVMKQRINYGVHNANIVIDNGKIVPTVLMATYFQQSPLVFVAAKEITHPSQLVGKTIMGSRYELKYSSLALLLKHYYVNTNNSSFREHSFNIDGFANKNVDVMSAYITNELFELKQRDIEYSIIDPVDYGISMSAVNLFTSREEAINHPNRTRDFIIASNKGWAYAISHINETISVLKQQYRVNKSFEALDYEAEISKKLMLLGFFDIGEISKELSFRAVKQLKYSGLLAETENLGTFVFEDVIKKANLSLSLTEEERRYLVDKKQITMCVDPEWMPFESIEEGKHIGITADVIALFNQKLPIPIVLIPTESWAQSLQKAKQRQCDILSLAAETPDRTSYMNFTSPYIELPIVMATKIDVSFIADISEVKDKPIGVVKGYAIGSELKASIPGINLVEVDSISEGLERVENGEIFGYVDNLMVISDSIQKEFTGELKVSSRLNQGVKLGIGTRNDEPQLHGIFETLVNNLSSTDLQPIYNKWVAPHEQTTISYGVLWKLLLAGLILGLAYLLHVSKLKKINKQLTILSTTDRLTGLYNRLKTDRLLIEKKAEVDRYEVDVSIILFDIDYFKAINDDYSHLIGDKVLVEFAQLLQHNIRETDYVGRWGGEEFIIICPNIDVNGATLLAVKLLEKVRVHPFPEIGKLTASAGVSHVSKQLTIEQTVHNADRALYQSKQKGRNQVSTSVE